MVQLSGPNLLPRPTRVETLQREAHGFSPPGCYETGAGTSEIRRMLTGRELYAETL